MFLCPLKLTVKITLTHGKELSLEPWRYLLTLMITGKHSVSLKMWNFQDAEKVAQAHTVRKGHRQDLNQFWLLTQSMWRQKGSL